MVTNLQLKMLLIGFTLLFLGIPPVHAAPITVPSGLNPGDPYRLVFVTSGRTNATSTNIYYYNSFVTAEAAASDQLWALRTEWTAIASTETVDARHNTDTVPGSTATDVPVYNLAGEMVASSYTDLWDGLIDSPILYDPTGEPMAGPSYYVWTGTYQDGWGCYLLGRGVATVGLAQYIEPHMWINALYEEYEDYVPTTRELPLYAMSGVLTYPQIVPAPTSIVLLSSGIFGLLGLRRKARKV